MSVFSLSLSSMQFASAHGDGYTDCEMDPVYERNFSAAPKIGLFMRERACMSDSPIIKTMPAGVEITVIAETDGWYKVKDSDGIVGWAGASLINKLGTDTGSGKKLTNAYKVDNSNITATKTTTKTSLTTSEKEAIKERVKGYILLQVEGNGEAWYVNPEDGNRYYMKDGETAYEMMRTFGLGISNANLSKLKTGDYDLKNRLKGKIVLQVEEHGEAYYVHPKDGSVHYLKDGDAAYEIMREQSLGITDTDLSSIDSKTLEIKAYSKDEITKKETENETLNLETIKESCVNSGGEWYESKQKCKNIGGGWCNSMGGTYNGCETAVKSCTPLCYFNK